MKKILAVAFAALSLATFGATMARAADAWVPPTTYVDPDTRQNYDIVVGKADAPITIYEYASLTCPHCKAFQEQSADEIRQKWIDTGKAKLVYRHYPLDQSALAAALTVECMPEDKRYDAVKLFFSTVQQWAANQDVVTVVQNAYGKDFNIKDENGKDYATKDELGHDFAPGVLPTYKQNLIACVSRKDFVQHAMQSMLDANKGGVDSTPYFVIDGEHVRGAQPSQAIDAIIQKHLDAKAGVAPKQ